MYLSGAWLKKNSKDKNDSKDVENQYANII